MIKTIRLMFGFMAIAMLAFVASCSDDDSNIGKGGSVPVDDGFYVAQVGVTPTIANALVSEQVEGDGFANIDREGFYANFMYLVAGNYNIVNVIDQEIAQTYGGTIATVDNTGVDCDALKSYSLIEEYALNGPAFNVATTGFYKVMMDNDLKELILVKITTAQIIGGATEFGWGYNEGLELPLLGAASATSVEYKGSGFNMKSGDWKIRFNCQWKIDRRLDTEAGYAFANGYVAHTNLGGSVAALTAGSTNLLIPFGSDGSYTIDLKWTPANGWTVTLTNDVPVAPKGVETYAWSIIGDPNGWTDTNLTLQGGSTATSATYEVASVTMAEGNNFKFRANADWGIKLSPNATILGTVSGATNFESTGGGDPNWVVKVGGAGNYKVTVSTTNTGETWNITFVQLP